MLNSPCSRKSLYGKILLRIEVYLSSTLLMYYFSPVKYANRNTELVVLFVVLYQIAFAIGYMVCHKNESKKHYDSYANLMTSEKFEKLSRRIEKKSVVLIAIALFNVWFRLTWIGGSFGNLLNQLFLGISASSDQYYLVSGENVSNSILYVISGIGIAYFIPAQCILLTCFSRIKYHTKVIVILAIVLNLCSWVIIGKNKGLFETAIMLLTAYALRKIVYDSSAKKQQKRKNKKTRVAILVVACIALWYFFITIDSRTSYLGADPYILGGTLNKDTFLYRIIPNSLKRGIISLVCYLSSGYRGLDLSFSVSSTPLWGVGFSYIVMRILDRAFGSSFWFNTYQHRINEAFAWGELSQWHTFYVWIANNYGHLGTCLFMFGFGYLTLKAFRKVEVAPSMRWIGLTYLLLVQILYIPANNQVFGDTDYLISFLVYVIAILFKDCMRIRIVAREGERRL